MGKILLFGEVSKSALEDIAKQEDEIGRGVKKQEDFREPLLFGISNYINIPEEELKPGEKEQKKALYDVIFHYMPREKDLKEITPTTKRVFIVPIMPNPKVTPDLDYLTPCIYRLYVKNNAMTTFAIQDFRVKDRITDDKTTPISPSLTFFRLNEEKGKGKEIVEIKEECPRIPEKTFYKEHFNNPKTIELYFKKLRNKINRENLPPEKYL